MQRLNWEQKFTFIGSNLTDFFYELDFKLFHLITLSKNRDDIPHVCNVYDLNLFLMWQSIYSEIRYKGISQTVDCEDIFIIFVIIQYVSDFYVSYGDTKDNVFLSKSDELFKWYHCIFPHQTFEEKIDTVYSLFENHRSKL
jgi:hypothetical protein